jgi:drug/metabolite transporter (DMT)-like permease
LFLACLSGICFRKYDTLYSCIQFGSIIALIITGTSISQIGAFLFNPKSWKNSWTLVFPALVYTFQNNLQFVALSNIPATEFQLLSQAKTLTTAMFSVLFLGTRLSRVQWMALMLLVIGVALAQMPPQGVSSHSSSVHSSVSDSSSSLMSNHTYGVLAVLLLSVLSGAAGVYQEMVVKKYMDLSIHYLNIQVLHSQLLVALLFVFGFGFI